MISTNTWAVVLAGGDGLRLRPLTRAIAGDERPKQFTAVLGGTETLLERAQRRACLLTSGDRVLTVMTETHRPFYGARIAAAPRASVVIQPENRGTTAAILVALLRIAAHEPQARVVILPSDHWVSDDLAFMAHAAAASRILRSRADLVVLLGIASDRPEADYGWIEPGEPIFGPWPGDLYGVRRFVEKPSAPVAATLHTAGALWNSFVMVGRVPALLAAIHTAVPSLYGSVTAVRPSLETAAEAAALERAYLGIPVSDFSRDVLQSGTSRLGVLPVKGVEWSDLGDPRRVLEVRERAALLAREPWVVR